ncbi:MAG: two-component system sensor histidine kinase HydH [Planctomycetota bacterium]|jgi:two-component system sensor histidine kinase HydH
MKSVFRRAENVTCSLPVTSDEGLCPQIDRGTVETMADNDEQETDVTPSDPWGPAAPVPPSSEGDEGDPVRGQSRRRLLARLAGGLAHEIKNPLSTMAINLTLLEEEFQPAPGGDGVQSPKDKRSMKRVRTLQREIGRLEGILDDFLHYARGGEINRAPGDLVGLLREVLEFAGPELEAENIRLHASLPTALPMVMLDAGAFRQVVTNLLVNARQAMPGGGELIVELRRDGSRAELAITDSGVGMNEDQLERCFDLYYSTKRAGTGLGLATVRRIVEMHDGEIGVLSEEARGTRFHIWLPLLQEIPIVKGDGDATSAESPT